MLSVLFCGSQRAHTCSVLHVKSLSRRTTGKNCEKGPSKDLPLIKTSQGFSTLFPGIPTSMTTMKQLPQVGVKLSSQKRKAMTLIIEELQVYKQLK